MSDDGRTMFAALLSELQQGLQSQFVELAGQDKRGQGPQALHRLLLGVELLSTLEEQTVLPALHDADPTSSVVVNEALHEIDILRDVVLLVRQTAGGNRDLALAVLEGMVMLHHAGVNELLAGDGARAVDWNALALEARALLNRWQTELQQGGEIEDEDADPVGQPTTR